jgi:hypothetical protein
MSARSGGGDASRPPPKAHASSRLRACSEYQGCHLAHCHPLWASVPQMLNMNTSPWSKPSLKKKGSQAFTWDLITLTKFITHAVSDKQAGQSQE